MKKTILALFSTAIALIATDLQAEFVYDNFSAGGAVVNFNSQTNQAFNNGKYLTGDDITSTLAAPAGATWRVDAIDLFMTARILDADLTGNGGTGTSMFNNIDLTISFISGVTSDPQSFADGTLLGSETFNLGNFAVTGISAFEQNLTFTNGIDIGSGDNIGITFEFFDPDFDASIDPDRREGLTVSYRNLAGSDNTPSVGSTTDRNFRDSDQDGVIDAGNAFGFGSDAGHYFRLNATAVPEPGSLAILGLFGIGMVSRRRR